MSETLYSTICQLLASVLGLTAVFIELRYQSLQGRILGFGQRVLDEWASLKEYYSKTKGQSKYDSVYFEYFEKEEPKEVSEKGRGTGRRRLSRIKGAISTGNVDYLVNEISKIRKVELDLIRAGKIGFQKDGFGKLYSRMESLIYKRDTLAKEAKWMFGIGAAEIMFSLITLKSMNTRIYNQYSDCIFWGNMVLCALVLYFAGNIIFTFLRKEENDMK